MLQQFSGQTLESNTLYKESFNSTQKNVSDISLGCNETLYPHQNINYLNHQPYQKPSHNHNQSLSGIKNIPQIESLKINSNGYGSQYCDLFNKITNNIKKINNQPGEDIEECLEKKYSISSGILQKEEVKLFNKRKDVVNSEDVAERIIEIAREMTGEEKKSSYYVIREARKKSTKSNSYGNALTIANKSSDDLKAMMTEASENSSNDKNINPEGEKKIKQNGIFATLVHDYAFTSLVPCYQDLHKMQQKINPYHDENTTYYISYNIVDLNSQKEGVVKVSLTQELSTSNNKSISLKESEFDNYIAKVSPTQKSTAEKIIKVAKKYIQDKKKRQLDNIGADAIADRIAENYIASFGKDSNKLVDNIFSNFFNEFAKPVSDKSKSFQKEQDLIYCFIKDVEELEKLISDAKNWINKQVKKAIEDESRLLLETYEKKINLHFNELSKKIDDKKTKAEFLINEIGNHYKTLKLQSYNQQNNHKLPSFLSSGVKIYYPQETSNVGFLLSNSQIATLEKIKKGLNEKNDGATNIDICDYLGSGKSTILAIIAGEENKTMKGTDGKIYTYKEIRDMIFGDQGVESLKFDFACLYDNQKKLKSEIEMKASVDSFLSKITGHNNSYYGLKNIVISYDEFHKIPPQIKAYIEETTNRLANQKQVKIFNLFASATPYPSHIISNNLTDNKLGKLSHQNIVDSAAKLIEKLEKSKNQQSYSINYLSNLNTDKKYHFIVNNNFDSCDIIAKDSENPNSTEKLESYLNKQYLKLGLTQEEKQGTVIFDVKGYNETKEIDGYLVYIDGKLQNKSTGNSGITYIYDKQSLVNVFYNDQVSKITFYCCKEGADFGISGQNATNTKLTMILSGDAIINASPSDLQQRLIQNNRTRTDVEDIEFKESNNEAINYLTEDKKDSMAKSLKLANNLLNLQSKTLPYDDKKVKIEQDVKLVIENTLLKYSNNDQLNQKQLLIQSTAYLVNFLPILEKINAGHDEQLSTLNNIIKFNGVENKEIAKKIISDSFIIASLIIKNPTIDISNNLILCEINQTKCQLQPQTYNSEVYANLKAKQDTGRTVVAYNYNPVPKSIEINSKSIDVDFFLKSHIYAETKENYPQQINNNSASSSFSPQSYNYSLDNESGNKPKASLPYQSNNAIYNHFQNNSNKKTNEIISQNNDIINGYGYSQQNQVVQNRFYYSPQQQFNQNQSVNQYNQYSPSSLGGAKQSSFYFY